MLPAGVTHYRGSRGENVRALAEALETNSTLTSLDLSRNGIGAEGAARLAAALKKNSTMTSLDISRNDIGPEGAESLATALEKKDDTRSALCSCAV